MGLLQYKFEMPSNKFLLTLLLWYLIFFRAKSIGLSHLPEIGFSVN